MDWMEEAHLSRSSASQLELGSSKFTHPYVAQELCIYERMVRQDTVGPNMRNFVLPGSSTVVRSDSCNSSSPFLSGSQQQTRQISSAIPHQFRHIPGSSGLEPCQSSFTSSTHLYGCSNFDSRSNFQNFGQSRETTTMHHLQSTTARDVSESTGLNSPQLESFRETLSQMALENCSNANQQSLFAQSLTKFLNKKWWSQNMQGAQAIPPVKRSVQLPNTAVSSNMQSGGASSSRLRVFCTSYMGSPLSGELLLTESGRLDVICSCHFYRMSVAKFSQHAGNFSSNPGHTVHIENGETLIQWRKALFWQYQVKVPADDAGWEWNDNGSDFGEAKYKAGPSQLKEFEASEKRSLIVDWNRYTQAYDNLGNGENPSIGQSLQNLPVYAVSSSHGDARAAFHDEAERQKIASASFTNTAGFGPVSEYFDFINHAGHSCNSTLEQQAAAIQKDVQKRHSLNNWQFGREHIQQEKEILSTIELKLGQPSQQAQSAGTPFISSVGAHVPFIYIDHSKSLLHEKGCRRGKCMPSVSRYCCRGSDPRMQQDIQNSCACVMPSFTSVDIPSKGHHLNNTQSRGSERIDALQSLCFNVPNAHAQSELAQTSSAIIRPVKDFEACMLANMKCEPNEAHLHRVLANLEGQNEMDKLHVYMQKTDRKVTLESAASTEEIATEVFVTERHDVEAFPSSRTSTGISCWRMSNHFLEGGVERARGQSMSTDGIQNNCEHHSSVSCMVSRDSSKAAWAHQTPEDVANLYKTDSSVNPGLSQRSVSGERHGALHNPYGGLKGSVRLPVETGCDLDLSMEGHDAEDNLLQPPEVTEPKNQIYNEWGLQEKQGQNSSNETVTQNPRKQCLNENLDGKLSQFQTNALQSSRAVKYNVLADTEMCENSASSPAEVRQDEAKEGVPSDALTDAKTRESCATISCDKISLGQLSITGTSISRIVLKTGSSMSSRLKDLSLEIEENKLESGSNPSTLGTSSGHLVSVGENESALLCKFPFRRMKAQSTSMEEPCSALMQWKDSGKEAHGNADLVATCNPEEVSPDQQPLEEDFLSDTASQRVSAVAGSSHVTRRQLVSHLCSSANVLGEFCDGDHLIDEEASQGECESRRCMMNDVLDEDSGIGKCCSSNEVETRGVQIAGLHVESEPQSLKCSPRDTTDDCCGAKSIRFKHVSDSTEADLPLHRSDAEIFKPTRKRRKTMKWKKIDAAMAAAIKVVDAESTKPTVHVCHSKGAPLSVIEQESIWAGLNNKSLSKCSGVSAEDRAHRKRKLTGEIANPLASYRDERKMLDSSGIASKKAIPLSNSKLDGIIRKYPINHEPRIAKRDGYANSFRLRRAHNPFNLLASQSHSEMPVKAFAIKPSFPIREVLLGSLPIEAPISTNKGNTKHSESTSQVVIKNPKAVFGRKGPKTVRMVSLNSILKLPAKVPNVVFKDGSKVCVRCKTSDELNGLFHHKNQGATLGNNTCSSHAQALVSSKEARKRSLWELSSRGKDCSRATYASGSQISNVPSSTNNAGQLLAINRPVPLVNKARAADVAHSCDMTWIIPRSRRSGRSHALAKMNGWKRQSSRCADVKRVGLTGISLDASNGSNFSSANGAEVVHSKTISKELIQKVDQGLSASYTITPLTPNLYKSPAVSESIKVRFYTKDKKAVPGKRISNLSLNSSAKEPSKKTFEMMDIKMQQQNSLGKNSDNVAVSGYAESRDLNSHIVALGFHKNQSERTFLENHVDIVAGKELKKSFKSVALASNECCCVCGSSISDVTNRLVHCSQCSIKVHQCCYGVSKVPRAAWICRACKANVRNIACVLCGYGGGAMTRAQKTRGVVKGLLQAWEEALKDKKMMFKASDSDVYKGQEIGIRTEQSEKHKFMQDKVLGDSCKENTVFETSLLGHRTFTAFQNDSCFDLKGYESGRTALRLQRESCHWNRKFYPSDGCSDEGNSESDLQNLCSWNTITAALDDPTVTQWVHMVCALWMPGTRCLNLGTMGVFDVSRIASARRRRVCSICKRPGGSCIQCRFSKCSVPFHAWCAHKKGLLQTEVVDDKTGHVGFYGKCMTHGGILNMPVVRPIANACKPAVNSLTKSSCARTEGYNGRQTLQERAARRDELATTGCMAVSQEQINAWMQINDRKTSGRRFIKPPNFDMKVDHREYTHFKQEQGWRRLAVYKSEIHALGLYTAETILRGEMVVEYIGEIVGLRVADKREAHYHAGKRMQDKGACYLFRIDNESIIDATRKGGIARFVNHSCSPNCVAKVICVKHQKKVVFFAVRDINAGEEITYDYQFNDENGDKIPCLCGSKECRKSLN